MTVLITGASRGIGLEVARQLARRGEPLVITSTNGDVAVATAEVLASEYGVQCLGVEYRQEQSNQTTELARIIKREVGSLDAIFANAGIHQAGPFGMNSPEDLRRVFEVNTIGTIELLQACVRLLRKSVAPAVVVNSSLMATDGVSGQTIYAASKAALNGLMIPLAREFGKNGIRFNAVAPGYIDTDMMDALSVNARDEIILRTPMNRLGTSQDVARVVCFLLSSDSDFVTGQIIGVDGGYRP